MKKFLSLALLVSSTLMFSTAAKADSAELLSSLVSELGITKQQATGGMGALLGAVKSSVNTGEYSAIADSLPGLATKAAEAKGQFSSEGLTGLLATATQSLGGEKASAMVSMAQQFSSLDMSVETMKGFVPIVKNYLGEQGSEKAMALLAGALK